MLSSATVKANTPSHPDVRRGQFARWRLGILVVLLGLALAGLGWIVAHRVDTSAFLVDFVAYWAAGRLNLTGGNPYGTADLLALQQAVGWTRPDALLMWNPPLILTLVMPFSLFGFATAHALWLGMSAFLILVAADRLWWLYGGNPRQRWVALVFAFSFMPTFFMLRIGQTSVFVLAGLVGFLLAERGKRWWWAGASLPLLVIKPHIVYLVLAALVIWWLRKRRWQVIGGALVAGSVALLVPLLVNPKVYAQYYVAATTTPPFQWVLPTWGSALRLWWGWEHAWLVFVPPALGLVWYAAHAWRGRTRAIVWTAEMPLLLLVSTSTMAYGWSHDLIVLLPALIQMVIWVMQRSSHRLQWVALGGYVLFEGVALYLNNTHASSIAYIWMPPVLLLGYWWLKRQTRLSA